MVNIYKVQGKQNNMVATMIRRMSFNHYCVTIIGIIINLNKLEFFIPSITYLIRNIIIIKIKEVE